MKKSLYELAGVPPAAPAPVIEMAIKRRLQKLQGSGDPNAGAEAYALREALSVLADPKRRAAYDAKLAVAAAAEAKAAPGASPVAKAPPPMMPPMPEVDLGPIEIVQAATPVSRSGMYAAAVVVVAVALGGAWYMIPRAAKPEAKSAKAGAKQPAKQADGTAAPARDYYQREAPVQGQRFPRPGMDSVSEQPAEKPAKE